MVRSVTTGLAPLLGATHSGHRWHSSAQTFGGTTATGGSSANFLASLAGMGLFDVPARSSALLPTDAALLGHGGSPGCAMTLSWAFHVATFPRSAGLC